MGGGLLFRPHRRPPLGRPLCPIPSQHRSGCRWVRSVRWPLCRLRRLATSRPAGRAEPRCLARRCGGEKSAVPSGQGGLKRAPTMISRSAFELDVTWMMVGSFGFCPCHDGLMLHARGVNDAECPGDGGGTSASLRSARSRMVGALLGCRACEAAAVRQGCDLIFRHGASCRSSAEITVVLQPLPLPGRAQQDHPRQNVSAVAERPARKTQATAPLCDGPRRQKATSDRA